MKLERMLGALAVSLGAELGCRAPIKLVTPCATAVGSMISTTLTGSETCKSRTAKVASPPFTSINEKTSPALMRNDR